MKRLLLVLTLSIFVVEYSSAAKEKSTTEIAKKEIKANADKDSRKSSKEMEKDGWKSMPGRLPLDKQIERCKIAEVALDDKGDNIYVLGTHAATGGNYSAAKNIATVRAKGELASQLKTHIKRNIMDKNSNRQIDLDTIELLDETISATLESVDIDMAGVNNLMEIYRELDGGKREVMITLSVKTTGVVDKAITKIESDLAKKTNLLFK